MTLMGRNDTFIENKCFFNYYKFLHLHMVVARSVQQQCDISEHGTGLWACKKHAGRKRHKQDVIPNSEELTLKCRIPTPIKGNLIY